MSNDKGFGIVPDAIIHLANKQCALSPSGKVSSSTLFAAARFNSFIVASTSESQNDLIESKEESIKYFTEQYKMMFTENIDGYIKNYEKCAKNQQCS